VEFKSIFMIRPSLTVIDPLLPPVTEDASVLFPYSVILTEVERGSFSETPAVD